MLDKTIVDYFVNRCINSVRQGATGTSSSGKAITIEANRNLSDLIQSCTDLNVTPSDIENAIIVRQGDCEYRPPVTAAQIENLTREDIIAMQSLAGLGDFGLVIEQDPAVRIRKIA